MVDWTNLALVLAGVKTLKGFTIRPADLRVNFTTKRSERLCGVFVGLKEVGVTVKVGKGTGLVVIEPTGSARSEIA